VERFEEYGVATAGFHWSDEEVRIPLEPRGTPEELQDWLFEHFPAHKTEHLAFGWDGENQWIRSDGDFGRLFGDGR